MLIYAYNVVDSFRRENWSSIIYIKSIKVSHFEKKNKSIQFLQLKRTCARLPLAI